MNISFFFLVLIFSVFISFTGRTGTAVAAWLLYSGQFKNADVSVFFSIDFIREYSLN